jgi:hypothetical protein
MTMAQNPFEGVKAGAETAVTDVKAAVADVSKAAATVAADVAIAKADYVAADNAAIAWVKANPKKVVAGVLSIAGALASHFVWKLL